MRKGYTVVFSGWQGDLLPIDGLITCDLPEALEDGKPVEGVIRQEFIANEKGVLSIPLSGHKVIRCYEPTDPDGATLTRRELERDEAGRRCHGTSGPSPPSGRTPPAT